MLTFLIGFTLIAVLVGIFLDARRRTQKHVHCIAKERSSIISESGATASSGVFHSPGDTTIMLGASEELGVMYYRLLCKGEVINRSRFNLFRIARAELHVDFAPLDLGSYSRAKPGANVATEVASRELAKYTLEELRALRRVVMRIFFIDEKRKIKRLEIIVMRSDIEMHRSSCMELFREAIWWTVFLNCAGEKARDAQKRKEELEKK